MGRSQLALDAARLEIQLRAAEHAEQLAIFHIVAMRRVQFIADHDAVRPGEHLLPPLGLQLAVGRDVEIRRDQHQREHDHRRNH